jgi:hypothetical protein
MGHYHVWVRPDDVGGVRRWDGDSARCCPLCKLERKERALRTVGFTFVETGSQFKVQRGITGDYTRGPLHQRDDVITVAYAEYFEDDDPFMPFLPGDRIYLVEPITYDEAGRLPESSEVFLRKGLGGTIMAQMVRLTEVEVSFDQTEGVYGYEIPVELYVDVHKVKRVAE